MKYNCDECHDLKAYWTEWSDKAENNPELKALVLYLS